MLKGGNFYVFLFYMVVAFCWVGFNFLFICFGDYYHLKYDYISYMFLLLLLHTLVVIYSREKEQRNTTKI